ncbi:MAG: alpha-hydroxy-acid oxidizing protein [Alphaproteobacteria bacterium]|jgi:L-lactate dehydrogenase (cytochrome)|nr:alpha-hydroxy-acid oxidizing protein [Alphaproteobacteria bacterium]
MAVVTTIEEFRQQAKRRVPKMFYDYADSGSWSETTYRSNETDFARIKFRQRVAIDMSQRTTSTILAGQPASMPVAIAPTGLTGMQIADGEILAAQAAAEFGVPFTLSTMSVCSIEDVAKHSSAPFWFQLYVMKDHDFSKRLVQRAKAAECSALVVTLDLQLLGQRHKDIKNGLSTPPKLTFKNIADMVTKPRWCLGMLGTKRHHFGNIVGHVDGVSDLSSLSSWVSDQFDLQLDWDDIARIRDWWGGKLILKGIMDPEDAKQAGKIGADAIVVSNHGGRQLDGAESSIAMLPEVVAAVGNEIDVWMDSGVRSGQDVLKAIALGAKGVMIGRAFIYALGANGKQGVSDALHIIHKELDYTMAMCGHRDIHNVDRQILRNCPF